MSKTLKDLAIEHNLSGEELLLCSNYLVAIKASEKKIKPNELMAVVNNFDKITNAVNVLNHCIYTQAGGV